tara:strand:+ start:554 stop:760 length:207 start_codon:yes stop_codon:yes gene_type:complete
MELGNMNMAEEARLARVSQLTTNRRRLRAAKRSMRSQIEVLERDIERIVGKLELVAEELTELWIEDED